MAKAQADAETLRLNAGHDAEHCFPDWSKPLGFSLSLLPEASHVKLGWQFTLVQTERNPCCKDDASRPPQIEAVDHPGPEISMALHILR